MDQAAAAAADADGGTMINWSFRDRFVAFCMCRHTRLGSNAQLKDFCDDVLKEIMRLLDTENSARCLQAALRRVLFQDMWIADCSSARCRRLFGGADAICVKTECDGALHSVICTLLRTFYS